MSENNTCLKIKHVKKTTKLACLFLEFPLEVVHEHDGAVFLPVLLLGAVLQGRLIRQIGTRPHLTQMFITWKQVQLIHTAQMSLPGKFCILSFS